MEILQDVKVFELMMPWFDSVGHFAWLIHLPNKYDHTFYDLKKIGHIDAIPSYLCNEENGTYMKDRVSLGTLEIGLVYNWISQGGTPPKAQAQAPTLEGPVN